MKNRNFRISMLTKSVIISLIAVVFAFSSCQDEGDNISPETILEETTFAENVFTELAFDIDDAIDISNLDNGRFGKGFGRNGCATREVSQPEDGGFPKVITIDFGEACENGRGMTRSGKIVITLTGERGAVGTQIIQTFENFYVNDHLIEGTRTRTIESETVRTSVLEGGKITTPEGEVFTRTANRTFEKIEGADTEERRDDVFQITGSASGVTPSGVAYTREITVPLIKSKGCPWVSAGEIVTTRDGATTTLNFGDGTCDNVATRTTDEGTEEITMDFRVKRRMKFPKGN